MKIGIPSDRDGWVDCDSVGVKVIDASEGNKVAAVGCNLVGRNDCS